MVHLTRLGAGLLILALLGLACRTGPPRITAHDAWTWATARPGEHASHGEGGHEAPTGIRMGAVYLVLRNEGGQEDALVGGETPVAEAVELHQTTRNEEGVVTMRRVERVPLPPGKEVAFQPGGLHLMLIRLRRDLRPGDTFPLTLRFEAGEPLTVQVEVRTP